MTQARKPCMGPPADELRSNLIACLHAPPHWLGA